MSEARLRAPHGGPVRIVLAKLGLDGHDRGLKVVARMLRDAGAEVVYLGLRQTTETVVAAAQQEDADLIGISMHNGGHTTLAPRMVQAARAAGVHAPVVVGGIIPDADGYYHTGDAGFFSADGHLFFKGRLGEMIKTGGANVAPRELELVMATLPEILSAHAVGIPHPERGENVAVAVVLREGARLDAATLHARLKDQLSAYKLPRHTFFVSGAEIPMTDSGKLDRRKLQGALAKRVAAGEG